MPFEFALTELLSSPWTQGAILLLLVVGIFAVLGELTDGSWWPHIGVYGAATMIGLLLSLITKETEQGDGLPFYSVCAGFVFVIGAAVVLITAPFWILLLQ